jgi:flavin-dependent dehydrogenase
VLKGRRVARILGGVSHVDVLTDDGGHVRGRCAIIATGVGYRFHQAIGSRAPAVLHTAQLEVAAAPADVLEVHLGRELAPQGFAWLVPVRRPTGSYVKAGVLLRGDARAHLHAFLRRPDIRRRLDEEPGEPVRRLLPVGPVRRSYGERVLAVGDAAGLTKPVTGGGIFYSLLSASMAAETLIDALGRDDLRAERLARYETRWRARLGPELRAGIWFRRLLGNLSDAELERFVGAAASSDVQAVVASMARFNWHRAAIRAVIRQPGMKSIVLRCLFR